MFVKTSYPFTVSLFVFLPSLLFFYGIHVTLVRGLDASTYDNFIYQLGGVAIFYIVYSVPVILGTLIYEIIYQLLIRFFPDFEKTRKMLPLIISATVFLIFTYPKPGAYYVGAIPFLLSTIILLCFMNMRVNNKEKKEINNTNK